MRVIIFNRKEKEEAGENALDLTSKQKRKVSTDVISAMKETFQLTQHVDIAAYHFDLLKILNSQLREN